MRCVFGGDEPAERPVDPVPDPAPRPLAGARELVRANFCGHRDHRGRVVFDPEYFPTATREDRIACYAVKRGLGLTHVVLEIPEGNPYPRYRDRPGPLPDWRADPTPVLELIREAAAEGFYTVLMLTSGDTHASVGLDDGELARKAAYFRPVKASTVFVPGYELVGSENPTIRTAELGLAGRILHAALGDDAVLAVHFDPAERWTAASKRPAGTPGCHYSAEHDVWVEDDDPSGGDEIGWWHTADGRHFVIALWQARHGRGNPPEEDYRNGPEGTLDPHLAGWRGRLWEGYIRFNRPRPPAMAAFQPGAPDWMAGRPPVAGCGFELAPYGYVDGSLSDDWMRQLHAQLDADGVVCRGG